MELTAGVTNYGDAPIVSVDGVASIEFISTNKIRVTYYVAHRMADGQYDRRVCLSIDWDADEWISARDKIKTIARAATVRGHRGEVSMTRN